MTIGQVCKDGYVIGSENKFVTRDKDRFIRMYAEYYWRYGRECPLNHRQLRKVLRGLGMAVAQMDFNIIMPALLREGVS